ncbi:RHOBTB1 [Symbiodinium pilosum]|uniref:RHOBTB1 protein n=1 Tax=Symbiodinium pilosum TaxID=2952 RepID=A0A812UDC3_SYMPI|nr:RHOBTB1 [Symbiodinium pilosum]
MDVGHQDVPRIRGEAWLPHFSPALELKPLDFALAPAIITFRLADGSCLYSDQHMLIQRSEYFALMFAETSWQEGVTKEVDLSSDPHADRSSMAAVLHYLTTGQVACQDFSQMLSLHKLADQLCLPQLVHMVEQKLSTLLTSENVLPVLGHVAGSGSLLETQCGEMLAAESFAILEQQGSFLDQAVKENTELAKTVVHLLLKVVREQHLVLSAPTSST